MVKAATCLQDCLRDNWGCPGWRNTVGMPHQRKRLKSDELSSGDEALNLEEELNYDLHELMQPAHQELMPKDRHEDEVIQPELMQLNHHPRQDHQQDHHAVMAPYIYTNYIS